MKPSSCINPKKFSSFRFYRARARRADGSVGGRAGARARATRCHTTQAGSRNTRGSTRGGPLHGSARRAAPVRCLRRKAGSWLQVSLRASASATARGMRKLAGATHVCREPGYWRSAQRRGQSEGARSPRTLRGGRSPTWHRVRARPTCPRPGRRQSRSRGALRWPRAQRHRTHKQIQTEKGNSRHCKK